MSEPDPTRVPDLLRKSEPAGGEPDAEQSAEPEVGEFRQGNPFSRASLAGYLVGRVIAESLSNVLYVTALVLLGLGALAYWLGHSVVLGVVLLVLAVGVLIMRWLLIAVLRRLTGFTRFGPIEDRLKELVADTRRDVLRELRRVGLPSRTLTVWLVPLRLLRPGGRVEILRRLRAFEASRAVSPARVDELHLLLRQAVSGGRPSSP